MLDFFEELYREEVMSKGAENWKIEPEWSKSEVNAYAMQYSGNWTINVMGGLARHHAMTVDGLAHVICHEIGHHLGWDEQDLEERGLG